MEKKHSTYKLLILFSLSIVMAGCEMNSQSARIIDREKCRECHTINGTGGSSGPNLTNVGSRRSRDYIIEQIKNPKSHKADTAMPSFSRLPEQDINALADYLSRRK